MPLLAVLTSSAQDSARWRNVAVEVLTTQHLSSSEAGLSIAHDSIGGQSADPLPLRYGCLSCDGRARRRSMRRVGDSTLTVHLAAHDTRSPRRPEPSSRPGRANGCSCDDAAFVMIVLDEFANDLPERPVPNQD